MSTPDAIAIHPNGFVEELTRAPGEDWYTFLRRAIEVENIEVAWLPGDLALVLDEDGPMRGAEGNSLLTQVATMIAGRRAVPLVGRGVFVGTFRASFTSLPEGGLRRLREVVGDIKGGPH